MPIGSVSLDLNRGDDPGGNVSTACAHDSLCHAPSRDVAGVYGHFTNNPSTAGRAAAIVAQIRLAITRIYTKYILWLAALLLLGRLAASVVLAQRTAREVDERRGGATPNWKVEVSFKKDVFTFVRIKYSVNGRHGFGRDPDMRWAIDTPDSDLNFSFRLQQVTSLKVDPDGKVLEITDKALFDYPFIYIVEPGRLTFTDEEIPILRRYLLNGGFLMCDDFWGNRDWINFSGELKRVFPERTPIDLPLDHPIFHCVFDLKERPQVPGVDWGIRSEFTGITYEANHNPGAEEVHYRAILDDKGRIMVMLCHNTDLGDGWEREGESEYYFKEFSEKKAYPLGINIVFYAMTH